MAENNYIDVPLGPGIVEYYDGADGADPTIFDITKGGIVFSAASTKHDITVDQYGSTVVKSVFNGRSCQVVIPFALNDLKRIGAATPNSEYIEDATDPTKKQLKVYSQAGHNMTKNARKLIIKPTDPEATANDWITIPLASPMSDPEYTYNAENERIANLTYVGYPDLSQKGLLYVMGDVTAIPAPTG